MKRFKLRDYNTSDNNLTKTTSAKTKLIHKKLQARSTHLKKD